jgi:hypothetical protein
MTMQRIVLNSLPRSRPGVESFVTELKKIGAGESDRQLLPVLLLETSQLLLVGGWLGAISDVGDAETDDDLAVDESEESVLEELREQLATLFGAADFYVESSDPFDDEAELTESRLSNDLVDIIAEVTTGLTLFQAGQIEAALSVWQLSYLSDWGTTLSAVHRAIQCLVSYARLEGEDEYEDDDQYEDEDDDEYDDDEDEDEDEEEDEEEDEDEGERVREAAAVAAGMTASAVPVADTLSGVI